MASFLVWASILLQLFLIIRGYDDFSEYGSYDDMNIDDSSLRRIPFRNTFQPMPIETIIDDDCQTQYPTTYQYPVQTTENLDPPIDSFINSNENAADILLRLEIKFDRIMDSLDFEKDNRMHDISNIMNILSDMHRYIQSSNDNADKIAYSNENGIPHSRSIKELKEEVGVVNKKLRNIEFDVDQVMTNVKKTIQSLDTISYTIQDIDQRTIRIEESYRQQQLDPVPNYISNENEIAGRNRFLSSPARPQTQFNKDENMLGYGNIENEIQLRENVRVGHNNPPLTTNTRTQFNENDMVGSINPSIGHENVKPKNQLNKYDISGVHANSPGFTNNHMNEDDVLDNLNSSIVVKDTKTKSQLKENEAGVSELNPPLTTFISNQHTPLKEDDIDGSINPSMGHENIKPKNQLNKYDVSGVHTNSPGFTNNHMNEGDVLDNLNPSMIVKDTKTKSQLKENKVSVSETNPPLATSISNQHTYLKEDDIVGSINPSMGLENIKIEKQINENEYDVGNEKLPVSKVTTNILPQLNEADRVGSINMSTGVNIKNTKTENQFNKYEGSVEYKSPPLNTTSINTRTQLNEVDMVGSIHSSTGSKVDNSNLTLTSRNSSEARNPYNITTQTRSQSQSRSQLGNNETIIGKNNPSLINSTTNAHLTKNSSMVRTTSKITTTKKFQLSKSETIVGKSNSSPVISTTKGDVTKKSSMVRTPSNITTTTISRYQLNENDGIVGKRNSSNIITNTKSQSQLGKSETILGKSNPSLITSTTKGDIARNSKMARTSSDITTITGSRSKLNKNDTIGGKRNSTITTMATNTGVTTILGSNKNSSMARTPSNITTITKSQSQLRTNSTFVAMRHPSLTTTTESTDDQKITANQTNRRVRNLAEAVPNLSHCHELAIKLNGIYSFGSQDKVRNEAGRLYGERYCDFNTDNVAWTVIHRRWAKHRKENFNRTWLDYKHGFGILNDEFWFGNDFIHKLTSDGDWELRIVIVDKTGFKQHAVEYSSFKVQSEKNNFKLMVAGQRGTFPYDFIDLNNQDFSTYDRHNRGRKNMASCAALRGIGWWFKDCKEKLWFGNDELKLSRIMIRPKQKLIN